mgnify:CR=1 FL=1
MKRILIVLALLLPGSASAYDKACAGWLCLPMGFGHPSCQPAKVEMLKRMLEFKSPLPSFDSCQVQGDARTNTNALDYQVGRAAFVPGGNPSVVLGQFCNFRDTGSEEPLGCVATLQTIQITETEMVEAPN